jgi:hypothetical protein
MMELIQRYYAVERHAALVAIGIGVVLAVLALFLWRTSSVPSLARGMAHVFLITALFQIGAGFVYTLTVNSRAAGVAKTYSDDTEHSIKQKETTRMEHVVKSGFRNGLVIYTALVVTGLVLLLLSMDVPGRKGMALALMVGVFGHCVEAFSMQANRHYLQTVLAQPVS